jgi:hypothetical protein
MKSNATFFIEIISIIWEVKHYGGGGEKSNPNYTFIFGNFYEHILQQRLFHFRFNGYTPFLSFFLSKLPGEI